MGKSRRTFNDRQDSSEARTTPSSANSLEGLANRRIEIGIDTEFVEARTLTIQAACRLDADTVAVKVYRDNSAPKQPPVPELKPYLPISSKGYGQFYQRLKLRASDLIVPSLSPARYLVDLLKLEPVDFLSRREGETLLRERASSFQPRNGKWDGHKERWKVPKLQIVLIGHFLAADFVRVFGKGFLRDLLETGDVKFSGHEPLGLVNSHGYRLAVADCGEPHRPAPGRAQGRGRCVAGGARQLGWHRLFQESAAGGSAALNQRDPARCRIPSSVPAPMEATRAWITTISRRQSKQTLSGN